VGEAPPYRKKILAKESSSRGPMTPCSESRKNTEATGLSTLLPTKHINMGTWNVRTMYQTGKTAQVAVKITKYKLALLGISEIRWKQMDKEEFL